MIRIPAYDLSTRNTFRIKASCALYVDIEAEEELQALDWSALPQPVMVLGGGSNILFTKDFPGTVLHIGIRGINISPVIPSPEGASVSLVTCGAGVVFDDFCSWAASRGLWGPENLSGIPGECGASAVQNIGAYGVEAKDILADIRAWDRQEGRFVNIGPETCGYGYRKSNFKTVWKGRYVITAVTYRLSAVPNPRLEYGGLKAALGLSGVGTPPETVASRPLPPAEPAGPSLLQGRGWPWVSGGVPTPGEVRDAVIAIRRTKLPDPEVTGSAGSFFCNPVVPREVFEGIEGNPPHYEQEDGIKIPAAWLIEQCGFKGARRGGAAVWSRQPLVIVNESGTALAGDIIGLEKEIVAAVKDRFGISLKPEVEYV